MSVCILVYVYRAMDVQCHVYSAHMHDKLCKSKGDKIYKMKYFLPEV